MYAQIISIKMFIQIVIFYLKLQQYYYQYPCLDELFILKIMLFLIHFQKKKHTNKVIEMSFLIPI